MSVGRARLSTHGCVDRKCGKGATVPRGQPIGGQRHQRRCDRDRTPSAELGRRHDETKHEVVTVPPSALRRARHGDRVGRMRNQCRPLAQHHREGSRVRRVRSSLRAVFLEPRRSARHSGSTSRLDDARVQGAGQILDRPRRDQALLRRSKRAFAPNLLARSERDGRGAAWDLRTDP
jgi:hypothetical protein